MLALGLFLLASTVPSPAARAAALDAVATAEAATPGVAIRPEASGLHGAVTAGHHLASQAGLDVLRRGGNAVDAAVTMAGVLAVVRPHMNGVGGDAFALIRHASSGEVHALNASGRAGSAATPAFFRELGHERVPFSGPATITVPGAVSGWAEALRAHGTIDLAEALAPAIALARDGFVVSQTLAEDLSKAAPRLNEAGRAIFMPGGRLLEPG
ncbi:MAG: gamma-glutamyltransferase, partial [Pseudomonadales bacterium]|nr:gamma-glutamyltransferase [Pseudomonadales bacterium]